MKVTAAGGDAWNPVIYHVRCRWLPWQPRMTSAAGRFVSVYSNDGGGSGGLGGLGDDALGGLIIVVLLVPLAIAAVVVLGEMALLLCLLPLLALWRLVLRKPWPVYVARNGGVLHVEEAPTLSEARHRRDTIAAEIADGTWMAESPVGRHRGVELRVVQADP